MEFKLLGHNYVTPDLVAKVTGKAKYAEDYRAEGMVFIKLMPSPRPHAKIRNIDASAALAMPGVHGILTAKDLPAPPPPPGGPPAAARQRDEGAPPLLLEPLLLERQLLERQLLVPPPAPRHVRQRHPRPALRLRRLQLPVVVARPPPRHRLPARLPRRRLRRRRCRLSSR